jgi:tetraacyldisaccharide 4'-kinase
LRAPISSQAGLAGLIVLSGKETPASAAIEKRVREEMRAPIIRATTRPAGVAEFRGRKVLAYAGIVNPERFFATLKSLGAVIIEQRAFADHHVFKDREARDLLDSARRLSADLVTTEKDLARLSGASGEGAELRDRSFALPITVAIEGGDLATLKMMIGRALGR